MFFIKTTIKIMSAIALIIVACYYLNTFSNTALCLVLILISLNAFFVYRFYFPDEEDGSFLLFSLSGPLMPKMKKTQCSTN